MKIKEVEPGLLIAIKEGRYATVVTKTRATRSLGVKWPKGFIPVVLLAPENQEMWIMIPEEAEIGEPFKWHPWTFMRN